jgi:sec-independent protein translocase protein TatC
MKNPFKRSERPRLKGPEDRMTLRDHLAELRVRIVRCMLAVTVGVVLVFTFYDPVLKFMLHPYKGLCHRRADLHCAGTVVGLGPLDGFTTRISISLWGGLALAFPVVLWQIWRFIVPGLHAREKKYAIPFIISSIVLFLLGGAVAYWTLDKALLFLITWSGSGVGQVFPVSKYVSLVGLMIAAYGIGFEFPMLLVFLQLVGAVQPRTLLRQWRYAIMIIFVIAAVITPSGDPISMCALAVPMSVFYMLSIVVGFIIVKRRKAKADEDDDGAALAGASA